MVIILSLNMTRKIGSMQHHKKVLPQNNPNARNKFFKVGHGK